MRLETRGLVELNRNMRAAVSIGRFIPRTRLVYSPLPLPLSDNVIHPVLNIRSAHGDVGKRGPAFSVRDLTLIELMEVFLY